MSTKVHSSLLRLVGARIRKARQKNAMTQEKLAEAVNMDRSYVSGLERGEFNMSLLTLAKIARALSISLAALVSGE